MKTNFQTGEKEREREIFRSECRVHTIYAKTIARTITVIRVAAIRTLFRDSFTSTLYLAFRAYARGRNVFSDESLLRNPLEASKTGLGPP